MVNETGGAAAAAAKLGLDIDIDALVNEDDDDTNNAGDLEEFMASTAAMLEEPEDSDDADDSDDPSGLMKSLAAAAADESAQESESQSIDSTTAAIFDATVGVAMNEARDANICVVDSTADSHGGVNEEAMDALRAMNQAMGRNAVNSKSNQYNSNKLHATKNKILTEASEGAFSTPCAVSNNAAMGLYNESNGRAEEDTRTHKDDVLPSVDANGGGRMTSPSQRQEDEGQNKQQTELAAAELSTISLGTDSAGVHHAEQAQRISVEKNTQRFQPQSQPLQNLKSQSPPLRYASEYLTAKSTGTGRAHSLSSNHGSFNAEANLFNDVTEMFALGKKAVTEAWGEVKQTVRDMNSKEVNVQFGVADLRLGMRLERRPIDNACEVGSTILLLFIYLIASNKIYLHNKIGDIH